jgi:hypothetical protein
MPRRAIRFIPVLWLATAIPSAVDAQHRLPIGGDRPSVQLELSKPFFEGDDGFGFATAMLDASVAIPLRGRTTLFGMLGITHATIEDVDASTLIANPRIGLLVGGEGPSYGEIHVDLPLATVIGDDDYAAGVAFASDPERLTRYSEDVWSVGGSFAPVSELESGATLGGRFGADLWIPTESENDTEVIGTYAGFARSPLGAAFIEAEVSGFAILSEGDLSFGERTFFLGTITAGFPESALAPELFLRLPIDDDADSLGVNATLGVRLRFGG